MPGEAEKYLAAYSSRLQRRREALAQLEEEKPEVRHYKRGKLPVCNCGAHSIFIGTGWMCETILKELLDKEGYALVKK